ncbi:MAG: hypothetical protein IPK62_03985 [Bacteroidetes bacterium]|nr:hypothetical protein [Bacteroidota bacterium]
MVQKTVSIIFFCFSLFRTVLAQQVPIGSWQSHFAYGTANTFERVGEKIFAAGTHLWAYSLTENDYSVYSKVMASVM